MKKTTILLVILIACIAAGALAYHHLNQQLVLTDQRLALASERITQTESNITALAKNQRANILHQTRMYIEERLYELNKPTAAERAAERAKVEAEILEHLTKIKAEQ
jgi:uncharacterized protein YcfL